MPKDHSTFHGGLSTTIPVGWGNVLRAHICAPTLHLLQSALDWRCCSYSMMLHWWVTLATRRSPTWLPIFSVSPHVGHGPSIHGLLRMVFTYTRTRPFVSLQSLETLARPRSTISLDFIVELLLHSVDSCGPSDQNGPLHLLQPDALCTIWSGWLHGFPDHGF